MGRIQVLADRVANQIAAGEVVERPASVCKELIENALDAGATRLRIELRRGGRSLVKVTDNGSGMNRDDAMLAFERHATSKLRTAADLLSIGTLGFRGEALPSIASVARVTLETREREEDCGTLVEVHGGRMRDVREVSRGPGTSVSVRNLFFNVPARRKFLRTERTELSHVVRTATHYSLAHLDRSLELRHERGPLLRVTPVATLRERIYEVFGGDQLDRLVEIRRRNQGQLQLEGFVSEPQAQRSNRNGIYVFTNRRLVRDRLLQRALLRAYENLLPKGVYPFALLFLELPAESVDVNVHPAKTEVRFREPSRVFDFVRETVRARLVADKPASGLPQPATKAAQAPVGRLPRLGGVRIPPPPSTATPGEPLLTGFGAGDRRPVRPPPAVPTVVPGRERPGGAPEEVVRTAGLHSRAPLADRRPADLGKLGDLRLLGQLHDSFIVAAGDDGVWIVDQHVAHERILFEKILRDRERGTPQRQRLLEPILLTLTPDRLLTYGEMEDELRSNGFEIEAFGRRTVAVRAVPAELSPGEVETLLSEILDDSREAGQGLTIGHLRRRLAATTACHAAIKANMPLTAEKMNWLLEELAQTDCPMCCPHGRPIALRYGTRDILKAFHRV